MLQDTYKLSQIKIAKMPKIIDHSKDYTVVSEEYRNNIICKIDKGEFVSECATGKKNHWWSKKHHPAETIPQNIYLCGGGKINEMHEKYILHYNFIEKSDFINYVRELIKQKILQ